MRALFLSSFEVKELMQIKDDICNMKNDFSSKITNTSIDLYLDALSNMYSKKDYIETIDEIKSYRELLNYTIYYLTEISYELAKTNLSEEKKKSLLEKLRRYVKDMICILSNIFE